MTLRLGLGDLRVGLGPPRLGAGDLGAARVLGRLLALRDGGVTMARIARITTTATMMAMIAPVDTGAS